MAFLLGVPQGLTPGPSLFSVYVLLLGQIMKIVRRYPTSHPTQPPTPAANKDISIVSFPPAC